MQRLTALWRVVCVCVCVSSLSSQIWERVGKIAVGALLLRTTVPKILHLPKRRRCDSDPAGAATPQIAPPTRAPAGRGPTDARHSRHARSRSHHGHRAATVTPESLQAAGKLPCATTMSSRRRRRHATAASSDFFCVPFGGRANGRVSTPPTPSATTAARRRVRRLHLRLRLRRLRPALPASSAHLRRDVQLGFRRRLRRRRPRLPPGPGPTACGPDHRLMW